ncbi:MAG: hypothetical protein Q617_SPSC00087G0002, partial [Streptococcus sp. DORA_10]
KDLSHQELTKLTLTESLKNQIV